MHGNKVSPHPLGVRVLGRPLQLRLRHVALAGLGVRDAGGDAVVVVAPDVAVQGDGPLVPGGVVEDRVVVAGPLHPLNRHPRVVPRVEEAVGRQSVLEHVDLAEPLELARVGLQTDIKTIKRFLKKCQ